MDVMAEQILLFGCDVLRANVLAAAADRVKVTLRRVERSQYNLPLGVLAQVGGSRSLFARAPYIGPELAEPMAVLCGFQNNARLDEVVAALNATGVGTLKCILTPENALWNGVALQRELQGERAQLTQK
jgi:hypothetical protein